MEKKKEYYYGKPELKKPLCGMLCIELKEAFVTTETHLSWISFRMEKTEKTTDYVEPKKAKKSQPKMLKEASNNNVRVVRSWHYVDICVKIASPRRSDIKAQSRSGWRGLKSCWGFSFKIFREISRRRNRTFTWFHSL